MKMELDVQGSLGPVTALCVHKSHVLAGCGSVIQVYCAETCELEASLVALPSSVIHGFQLGPVLEGAKHLCAFGAKCLRILHLDEKSVRGTLSRGRVSLSVRLNAATDVTEVEDWIWDVVWLQNGNKWTLGLALAHNTVLHWDWKTGTILHRATCVEKCILYCAHFIGSNWSNLVLAAGTVFNQVVLWSPSSCRHGNNANDDHPQPVLHRLTGHKGVIFSIFYHPVLQRICSVSDDRSIIMYQLCFPAPSNAAVSGGNDAEVLDWSCMTFEQILIVFGHSGRVWDVVLLSDVFVSIGEDAHCVVWSYSGDIVHKHRGHKGRSIWSLAASQDETFVVTGGGDGSVRKWSLQGKIDLPLTQVHLTVPDSVKVTVDDFVRTLALWDSDSVLLVSNTGSVLCYMITQDKWQVLVHDRDFSSYSKLARSTDGTYIAIAGISGHIRVLCKGQGGVTVKETKASLHSGKICGLTWVDKHHFLTTGLQGQCILAAVQHTSEGSLVVFPVAQLMLPASKYRWVVSGCLLPVPISGVLETESVYLICGDRNGSVHCYLLPDSSTGEQEALLPVQTFPKIHGSSGVTCVCYHDNTVYTAGRDGQYRRWTINQGQLQLLNSSRVFKGFEWIDWLWVAESGLQILGFYSSKFVVWDQQRGERLLEVECGGGHRSWDCQPLGQGYRFLFIKAREAVMVTAGQNSNQVIVKPPLHGMKVWDMKHICSHTDSDGTIHHVLCTGSEDTTLSLGTLHTPSSTGSLQWSGQYTLHAHLSSVRALAAVPSSFSTAHCPLSTCCQNHQRNDSLATVATGWEDVAAGREDPQGAKSASTVVVFSAGGRAQIQAWRVKAAEWTDECKNASATCSTGAAHQSHEDRCAQTSIYQTMEETCPDKTQAKLSTQPTSVTSLSQNPESSISDNSFAECKPGDATHTNAAPSFEEISADSRTQQKSLRIMYEHLGGCFLGESRHKRQHKPWKTRYLKLDPETRIMSLAAVAAQRLDHRLSPFWHILAAAGSDGILRLFLYDESNRLFTLLCQSSHHKGCILKVFIHLHLIMTGTLSHPNPSGSHLNINTHQSTLHPFLLSAATDGQIAIWDLRPVVQCLLKHAELILSHHHQGDTNNPRSDKYSATLAGSKINKQTPNLASSETNRLSPSLTCPGSNKLSSVLVDSTSDEHSACLTLSKDQEKGSVSAPDLHEDHYTSGDPIGSGYSNESEEGSKEDGSKNDSHSGRSASTSSTPSRPIRTQYLEDRPVLPFQHILADADDGRVGTQQDGNGCWSPNQEIKAHQSGVNSMHITSLADGSLLLVSGGDDNALIIHKLSLVTASKAQNTGSIDAGSQQDRCMLDVVSVATKLDAHAAQITGAWVLSSGHLVTASIDQRVNLWSLSQDFQLKLECSRFVDIADLSNMEVWQYGNHVYIGVCGEGICLLTLQDDSQKTE